MPMSIRLAKLLDERGKKPRVKLDTKRNRVSGQHRPSERVKRSIGIFCGVDGRHILCKPAKHKHIVKYDPDHVSICVAEADDETLRLMKATETQRAETQRAEAPKSPRAPAVKGDAYVIIDMGWGTVFCGKGQDPPFQDNFENAVIYSMESDNKSGKARQRNPHANASAACGHIVRAISKGAERYDNRVSDPINLKVVPLERAEEVLKRANEKYQQKAPVPTAPVEVELEGRVEQQVAKTIEKVEATQEEQAADLAAAGQIRGEHWLTAVEEALTSPDIKPHDRLKELNDAIKMFESALADAIESKRLIEERQKALNESINAMIIKKT